MIRDEVKRAASQAADATRTRYEQMCQVLEARAVRTLSDPKTSPRDLKAVAGTLAVAIKIRAMLGGLPKVEDANEIPNNIADLVLREWHEQKNVASGDLMGRCRDEEDGPE